MSVAILTQSSKRALKLGLLLKDGRNSSAIHQSSKNESSTASNSTSRHRNLHQLGLSDPIKSIGIIEQESMSPTAIYQKVHLQEKIYVAHRPPRDWSDWTALRMVRLLRWGMDFVTGYSKSPTKISSADSKASNPRGKTAGMDEQKWLTRFVFLESVAGVPGMVAGMLRHLHSLRRLQKDRGWIETLLEEAYNERMHLLTFLSFAQPSRFTRLMIIGAQGVFFNSLFIGYLISPRTCHRFVGYLEEEAVSTYSLAIRDIDEGKLTSWETLRAPDIAVKYWNMPEGERGMRDLLLRIRADEAKHREVNHTLGNLKQELDHNPFSGSFVSSKEGRPGKGIENIRATGWEREEVIDIVK